MSSVLAKMDKWDFDVFALQEVTNGHALVVGGMHLMTSLGVLDKIPIPKDKLATYLLNIERGYVPTNPFHNAVHATDVSNAARTSLMHLGSCAWDEQLLKLFEVPRQVGVCTLEAHHG